MSMLEIRVLAAILALALAFVMGTTVGWRIEHAQLLRERAALQANTLAAERNVVTAVIHGQEIQAHAEKFALQSADAARTAIAGSPRYIRVCAAPDGGHPMPAATSTARQPDAAAFVPAASGDNASALFDTGPLRGLFAECDGQVEGLQDFINGERSQVTP